MHLIDIVTAPWAILPAKLDEIRAIYETHLRGEKIDVESVEARIGRPLDNRRPRDYAIEEGVAIIPVEGPIAPKANLFTRISGGTSAEILARQVSEAASDPMVRAIMLEIDSPGGSVFGTPEAAAAVRAASDLKPVAAWSAGTIASGAYWIASAAGSIWLSSDVVIVGSIGVVATHVDMSKREAMLGYKTTEVVAGKYKRIASQFAPLTDEGRATMQEQVDTFYGIFVDAVAANRGASIDAVLEHMADGRIFIGQQAIAAGLADGVLSRAQLLAELSDGQHAGRRVARVTAGAAAPVQPQPSEKSIMQENTAPASITVDSIKALHPAVAQALLDEGRAAGAAAERERITAIEALSMPGCEQIVADAKGDGKSTAGDVAQRIVAARKKADADAAAAAQSQQQANANAAAQRLQQIQSDGPRVGAGPIGDDAGGQPSAKSDIDKAREAKALAAEKGISFAAAYKTLFEQPAA